MILPGYLKASRAASDGPRPSPFAFKALRALELVSRPPALPPRVLPRPPTLQLHAAPDGPLDPFAGFAEADAEAYDDYQRAEDTRENGREIDRKTIARTRTEHYCETCKGDIPAGDTCERYTLAGGAAEGRGFHTFYRCHLCQSGAVEWRGGGSAGDPVTTFEGSAAGPLYGRTR